jgi:hypothetical protein
MPAPTDTILTGRDAPNFGGAAGRLTMNRPKPLLPPPVTRFLAIASSKDPFTTVPSALFGVAILAVWLTLVVFTTTKHEFWRDEVHFLSVARAAVSPLDLYGLTTNEGHPVLWYLLLYIGKSIVDTPLVLPVTSILIAFAAVAVFLLFSPFPFWVRCLFIFSLPLYEYSVMARNYGISMLLLFLAALQFRHRRTNPFLTAFILALLANTNVHSIIFTCLIAVLWACDTRVLLKAASVQIRARALYAPLLLVAIGVLVCVVFTMPRANSLVFSVHHSLSMQNVGSSLMGAALEPGRSFSRIVPGRLPIWLASALLYIIALGLLPYPRLLLAALSSEIALGVFFRVVYGGYYRHQGLFLVFALCLYWLALDCVTTEALPRAKRLIFNVGFAALVIVLIFNSKKAAEAVVADIKLQRSSSKAFGAWLQHSAAFRDAILLPEPEYCLESLPYYAPNRIYLPRERRFGATVSLTTQASQHLSLGELVSIARNVKSTYGQPVLVVLGHWEVEKDKPGEKRTAFNMVFSWNAREFGKFEEATIPVAEFGVADGDEKYRVYVIR